MFGDADTFPTRRAAEVSALWAQDRHAEVITDPNTGVLTFYRSDGPFYQTGHGRHKCTMVKCLAERQREMPNNCGYNTGQWQYPEQFRVCGPECRGGLCTCLQNYV